MFEPAWFHTRFRARARTRECEKLAEAVALLERALELSIEHTQPASTTAHSPAVNCDAIGIVRTIS
jgi:citrate synthase